MKIYFAGSIRGGRGDAESYARLIGVLKEYGEVLTEHVGSAPLREFGEAGLTDSFIHDRDLSWIRESDIVVAEVSVPSLGVGYEIGRAVEEGKNILCLYRPNEGKRLSAMIAGCPDVTIRTYETEEETEDILREFFAL